MTIPGKNSASLELPGQARLEQPDGQLADLVLAHLRDGLWPQHAGLAELATAQQHPQEVQVVWPGRVQPAAAHEELGLLRDLERDRLERAVRLTDMHASQPRALLGADDEPGVDHPERIEDVLAEVRLERLPAEALDGLADPVDVDAVVPAIARIERQRQPERRVLALDDAGDTACSW